MVLPAVQSSREAALRTQCANQLRQLGLAVSQFEAKYRHLPPGHLGPKPARSVLKERDHQLMGLLPYLLPYIERGEIYSQIDRDMLNVRRRPESQIWVLDDSAWTAAKHSVSVFRCPSAPPAPPSKAVLLFLNPYFNEDDGLLILESKPGTARFAPGIRTTNYLGNAGFFGEVGLDAVDKWRGPFTVRSLTKVANIRDGASKTLLLGEAIGAVSHGELTFAYTWMGCGAMPLAFGIGDDRSWANFSSKHDGYVGFCFADGHVQFLAADITQEVLKALGGIADGEDVDVPET